MKWPIWTIMIGVVVATIGIIIIRQKSVLPTSLTGELTAPFLISDEAWRQSIAEDPTAEGYSGYDILKKRGSDIAIKEGLSDLISEDAYVWINAASYVGSRGHPEAVPYLIKALRHAAWRSDEEHVALLQQLTKQTFGNNFEQWRGWYESQPNKIEINWESSLGGSRRVPETTGEQNSAGPPATLPLSK